MQHDSRSAAGPRNVQHVVLVDMLINPRNQHLVRLAGGEQRQPGFETLASAGQHDDAIRRGRLIAAEEKTAADKKTETGQPNAHDTQRRHDNAAESSGRSRRRPFRATPLVGAGP